ncbi:MAG TPA: calcium-binding protein [Sphingomicrobium sp.]|nr:calcium-binding protein [Sphingomicrobium sp.]
MPIVSGTPGDDTLPGTIDHDLINGLQGNDMITADAGDDLVRPGTGDDYADGGSGIDRVSYASVGTDVVTGVTVSLALQGSWQNSGGGGIDYLIGFEHLTGTRYDDTLIGDEGDNWIWGGSDTLGNSGNDIISGGGGNDLIEVGAGTLTLDGGAGNDTLWAYGNGSDISSAGVNISLTFQGASQDTEQGFWLLSGFENLSGSIHDDSLSGDGNDNVLAGDAGNDVLVGGAGADTLYGDGQIGVDSHGLGYSGPITTTADLGVNGDDLLEGGAGDDVINGGGGSDTASFASWTEGVISGLGSSGNGFATNAGETEFDSLISIENLSGSAFGDQLSGNIHANTLSGGDGSDVLRGNAGNDSLLGGNGNDFLNGGQGDDMIDGGAGIDRATYFTGATAGVTVDLNLQGVAQNTGSQGMDTLTGIENVSGTAFNDMLTGDGGNNWLWGSPATLGDGSISAANNDTLNGGGGNDLLTVGIGNHSLTGGTGSDTVSFTENGAAESGLTVSLALQGVAQATGNGSWTLNGIENLSGGLADDHLTGDANDNVLAGDTGNDMLIGGLGNDTLYGDGRTGIDNFGGLGTSGPIRTWADVAELDPSLTPGNDVLQGGRGDDWLYGGRGNDTLTGNQGTDRFVIEANSGDDHVTDFAVNVDKIRFDASSGVDDFSDLTLTKVGNNTVISWGTADSLTLDGVKPSQLDSGDFEFGAAAAASMARAGTGKLSPDYDRPFEVDIHTGPHGAVAIAMSDAMII